MVAEGTPGELKASAGSGTIHVRLTDAQGCDAAEAVIARTLSTPVRSKSDPLVLTALVAAEGAEKQAAAVLAELAEAGIAVDNFTLGRPSLDEVFLALTDRNEGQEVAR